MRFDEEACNEQDGDREDELVKESINRINLSCHKPLDIEGCSTPEKGRHDLKDIANDHSQIGRLWSSMKNDEDARKSQNKPQDF